MSKINLKTNRIPILSSIIIALSIITVASAQVLIWSDSMTNFPTNWTTGGSGGTWTRVSNRYNSASYSIKCTGNASYSNNQNNWAQRTISLSGFENASVVFYIWQNTEANDYIYFEYLTGATWISHWARTGNYGGFAQQVMANIPNSATAIRFRMVSDSTGTNEGVYIDDVAVYGYRYDVGCTQINAPTGILDSGQIATPQAVVRNFGDFISTFNVRMRIGTFYSNAVQVANLAPGASTTVNFTNWTALQRGVQTVRCSTEHPNDINRPNDRQVGSVEVRVRNVGAASIVAPTGTIDSGQVITPRVYIRNYGTTPETFNAFYWLSTGYASTRSVTLNGGAAETTNFDPWIALPRGTFTTKCSTALATDMKKNDDRATGTVTVRVRDVGVTTILAPISIVDSVATLIPQAKIKNYGTNQENLTVNFRITGPGVNWTNTANVSSLNPNEERTITFSAWSIGPRGSYTARCTTNLTGDQISFNDKLDSNFVVRVHDVGVVSISSPPASVDSGATVPVTATVQNFGTETENFAAFFRIGSFYTSTQLLALNSGQSTVVTFSDWVVNQTRNNYSYKCTTFLASDANPNNNFKNGSVTVNIHDVGVTIISEPPSQLDSNAVSPVTAQITNYGTYPENFSVLFQIGSFYTSTRSIALAAGNSSWVSFDTWQVIQSRGSYATKCSTQLGLDQNPNNDAKIGSVNIMVHDVGVTTINAPPNQVDTNSMVAVAARVANYGTYTETLNVIYKIGSFYSSPRTVMLNPGNTNLTVFDNWTVNQPRGTYPRQCSTYINNDVNPANNILNGTVTIMVHDAGVISLPNLPANIDSGTPLTVTADIANYGTFSETFDVRLNINPGYSSTKSVTLTAGEQTAVNFDNWLPTIRNINTVECTTELSGDNNPTNDQINDSILVVVRDICARAIVAPPDTLTQGRGVIPEVRFENLGTQAATFPVWFKITQGVTPIYLDTVIISLEAGAQTITGFRMWHPESIATYFFETRCALASDMNPVNDVRLGSTSIQAYIAWYQKSNLLMGAGKKVKQGGCLVCTPESNIYALKGSNTNEFFLYNTATDTWTQACSMPNSIKPKKVKNGAALCYAQGYIYALKGCGTYEFWRYTPTVDSWYQKKSIPPGPNTKKIKGGSGLVYITKGDSNLIYCLKGSNTNEFYAYWVEMDTWLERKPVLSVSPGFKGGSCLAYDGNNNIIYALKNKTNQFYAYDVMSDSWQEKLSMPLFGSMQKKKKVKDGASMVGVAPGLIYAFKGGSTDEFWKYDATEDSWFIKEPIPPGLAKKRVKAGGALCFAPTLGRVFGLKGGNTVEFWAYTVLPSDFARTGVAQEGEMTNSNPPSISHYALTVSPNPFHQTATVRYALTKPDNIVLKLYDACGKLVRILTRNANASTGTVELDCAKLPAGIYILRLEGHNRNLTKKVIISR